MPDNPRRNPLDELAESFMHRYRNGERPALSEYTDRYPELADDIREVFPALVMMQQVQEDLRHVDGEPSTTPPAADLLPLSQLGDFRIIREVGRGGMGVVYEAEQVSLGRRVALKVLPKQILLDSRHAKRFEREARAAAKLHHTNIVPVFGVGQQDGLHYYVMQFIHGLGLDEVLVELKRLREASEFPHTTAEHQIVSVVAAGAAEKAAVGRDVSALNVAQSLLSGQFERTLLVESGEESGARSQESGDESQKSEVGGRKSDKSALTAPLESKIQNRKSKIPPASSTAVGHLSDTFPLPGQSEHSSKAHTRSVYWQSVGRIGVQSAEALQYAHDQGVIHRDVKPGNLLLDTRGCVWVTDFGLAKATDQQDLTHTGDVLGTLRYMAPEQFEGQADARSDVYSLGLTLYELLALQPGFDEKDRHRLIKQVTNGTPARLRTLDPHIPRDLETIVHKAIDREPSHRYQTAAELAADLQRYLGSEPIRARWVSPVTRFSRWCKRNPAVAGLTTTIALLLAAAAVASALAAIRFEKLADEKAALAVEANADKTRAEAAQTNAENAAKTEKELRTLAESERDRANTNFALARSAVNTYLDEVNDSDLLSVPGLQPLREKLLSSALIFYTKFTRERIDDPTLLIELADAQYRLGRIHGELGDKTAAAAANSEAIRLFERLCEQQPENLVLQGGLAHAYFWASRYDETIRRYDDTIRLCKSILETEPQNPEIRSLLADTYNTLAIDDKNDIATALAYHQQAFELRESLAREFPDDPAHLAELGGTVNNLGVLLAEQGKIAESLQMFERAVGYSARAYELQPHSIRWGEWLCLGVRNCAYKHEALGATDDARQSFARLVALRRDLAWNNPAVTRLQADLYRACLEQSRFEQQLGNEAEANRAIREGRRILEIIPHDTALQLAELALMYASLSQPVEGAPDETAFDVDERREFAAQAVASLREAIQAGYRDLRALKQDKLLNPLRERDDFRELLVMLEKLRQGEGLTANDKGTEEEQIANRRAALRILTELQDQLDVRTTLAAALHSIGVIQTGLKQFDEAETSFHQALQVRQELQQENPDDVELQLDLFGTRIARGNLLWNMGRYPEAHHVFQDCLDSLAGVENDPALDETLQASIAASERAICGRYAQIGLWDLAAEYSRRNFALDRVTDRVVDARFGYLLAFDSDRAVTSEFARRYSAQAGNQKRLLLWINALFRAPGPELTECITQGRILYETDRLAWNALALSLALVRNDEPQAALEMLESLKPEEQRLFGLHLGALLHRALGHQDEAVRWRERADAGYQQTIDGILASQEPTLVLGSLVSDGNNNAPPWFELVKVQILRHELNHPQSGGPAVVGPWQHLIQARGYRLIGEVEKSQQELAAAVGDTPDMWMARARLFDEWDDADRSEADWAKAVELAGDDPLPLIQRGRWYAERGEQEKADADFAHAPSLTPDELNRFLEAGWWVVGPVPGDVESTHALEENADPSQPVTVVEGKDPIHWRRLPTEPFGLVNLANTDMGSEPAAQYALAYVYCEMPRRVPLLLGGHATAQVWVNGNVVTQSTKLSTSEFVPLVRQEVDLQRGRNTILVRLWAKPNAARCDVYVRFPGPLDRAIDLTKAGLYPEAIELFELGLRQPPPISTHPWFNFTRALAGSEVDRRRYAEYVSRLFRRYDQDANKHGSFNIALAAGLAREELIPHDRLLEHAERQLATDPNSWVQHLIIALAQYRAGQFTKAHDHLLQHVHIQQTWPLQAMIDQQMGDADAAQRRLNEARHWYGERLAAFASGATMDGLWGVFEALLREASEEIDGQPLPPERVLHHLWRARSLTDFDLCAEAQAELQAALAAGADKQDVSAIWGALLLKNRETEGAESDWQQLFELVGDDPMPLIQRGRWYAQQGEHEKADADFAKAASLTPDELNKFLEAGWWVIGPYPDNLDEFCPPEIDPDPSKAVYVIDPQTGLSDEPVKWQSAATGEFGRVNLAGAVSRPNGSSVYALSQVYSPDERSVLLMIGNDSAMRVWVNGQQVADLTPGHLTQPHYGPAVRIPVTLRPGRNSILVKSSAPAITLRIGDSPQDRVVLLAEQFRLAEAAAALIELRPSSADFTSGILPWHVVNMLDATGDPAGLYERLCAGIAELVEPDLEHKFHYSYICAQAPNAAFSGHAERFVSYAEEFAEARPAPWSIFPAALANYRAGNFDRADTLLKRANWMPHDLTLRALLEHHAGNDTAAAEALTAALAAGAEFNQTLSGADRSDFKGHAPVWWWYEWAAYVRLLREAEQAILGETTRTEELRLAVERTAQALWAADPELVACDHAVLFNSRRVNSVEVEFPEPFLARGRRLAELGRFEEAEADFNRAVELASDDRDVFIARAIFHADRGAPEAAADDLHAALQLADAMDEGPAWVTRRQVALQAAIRPAVFERLVSHDEHGAENELWHARMVCLAYDGDLEAAYQAALQLERFGFEPQRAALALVRHDRPEFERIRDSIPADWNPGFTSRLLMLAPTDEPTTGKLLSTAQKVLGTNPDDWYARVIWGIALYRDGRLPEAREQLAPLANSHLRGVVWPVLAMIHHQLGDEPQARQWLQRSNDWLSWQHPGTSADAPRMFKPGVNGLEDWLVAAVFNQEARRLIDSGASTASDELTTVPQPQTGPPNNEVVEPDSPNTPDHP